MRTEEPNGDEGLARELYENDEPLPPVDYDALAAIAIPIFERLKDKTYTAEDWRRDLPRLKGVTPDRDLWDDIEDAVTAAGLS